jgi:hypothetical protein
MIISKKLERKVMQCAVAFFSLVPIGAGLAGIIMGPDMVVGGVGDISLDSHFRYLSGLLLGIGFGFVSAIPNIDKNKARFQLLTAIVFIGGLARVVSLINVGQLSNPMLFGLVMELMVTPLLCLWQWRISRLYHGMTKA